MAQKKEYIYIKRLLAIESCFSCLGLHLRDTRYKCSYKLAWLASPTRQLEFLGKCCNYQPKALQVTTTNNADIQQIQQIQRYSYRYISGNYSDNNSLPLFFFHFISFYIYFFLSIVRGRHFWRVIAITALCFCLPATARISWILTVSQSDRRRQQQTVNRKP